VNRKGWRDLERAKKMESRVDMSIFSNGHFPEMAVVREFQPTDPVLKKSKVHFRFGNSLEVMARC
jgi:hypothetical protein